MPNFSGLEFSQKESTKKVEPSIEKVSACFTEAIQATGNVISRGIEIEQNPALTSKEKSEIRILLEEAGKKLGIFYQKTKAITRVLPVMLVLGIPGDPVDFVEKGIQDRNTELSTPVAERKLSHIGENQLPFIIRLTDHYLAENAVHEYNQAVDFLKKRNDGKMSPEEISRKEQIAQNFDPFNYEGFFRNTTESYDGNILRGKGLTKRYNDVLKNKTGLSKEDVARMPLKYQIRVDLFRKYLGLEQFHNFIQESTYKPTQAQNPNTQYFCFSVSEVVRDLKRRSREYQGTPIERLARQLGNTSPGSLVKIKDFDALKKYIKENKDFPKSTYLGEQLGKYGCYVSHDKDRGEDYISYYDVWDLNPPFLDGLKIDVNQFNFPFEIYGRIYESDWKAN